MTYLTDCASGFVLIVGMRVGDNSNQEKQGEQRKRQSQRFKKSARERVRDGLHFRASCSGPRN
jgi:hypothetical protein